MNTRDLPLFSFGTLMDSDVLTRVSGQPVGEFVLRAARLPEHRQRCVAGEPFPVVQPMPGESTPGVLIYGLTPLALERIRFFEGDEYRLECVSVELPSALRVAARFFADTEQYAVTTEAWNLARWQRTDKPAFLQRIDRYMRLFGTMSATEADAHWLATADGSDTRV